MSSRNPDLFAALEQQRREIQDDAKRKLEAVDRAEQELRSALGEGGTALSRSRPTRAGIRQKAAQHHVDAVLDYMQKHTEAYQADVARALGLNSGTATLVFRQLADEGALNDTGRRRSRSPLWQFVKFPDPEPTPVRSAEPAMR